MKITLAICTNRLVQPKTLESLLNLVVYSKDIDFHILVANRGYTIAENRNYCVVQALKNTSDYIFWVDDDMTFPKDTLERLLAHQKEIVGVNSYSRCLPLASTVGLMDEKGEYKHPDRYPTFEMKIPDELFKAYFVGCGVCLMDMRIFDRIKKPWFAFKADKNGQIVHGEDGWFCEQAKKIGIDVFCDGSIPIGHIGNYEYGEFELPTNQNQ